MTIRSLWVLGVWVLLSACTGGNGSTTPSPGGNGSIVPPPGGETQGDVLRMSGKAIDGYIAGAHVYLDLDFDSQWDPGEPDAITGPAGDYALELPPTLRDCAEYVPLVVDVLVGAVDVELGPVESAYQMVRPPLFAPISDADLHHVTPLTTALWNVIQAQLLAQPEMLSCDTVMADSRARQELVDVLELAVARMVRHYNIPQERLFEDYVAKNDTESRAAAREIVRGLQQSFVETAALRDSYPGGFAFVDFHKGDYRDADWAYPDAWYRETNVFLETTSLFELVKMSDDLTRPLRTIIYGERTSERTSDHAYDVSYEYESRGGDASPYGCDIKEMISTADAGISYELVNLVSKSATVFEDCVPESLADVVTHRYALVSYDDAGIRYSAQFMYPREGSGFTFLGDWIDVGDRHGTLDMTDLVAALGALPYRYEDDVPADSGAGWWVKSKTYAEGANTVSIWAYSSGRYEKRTTYGDGTHALECSTDGVTWTFATVRCG